jgi:3-oxoacyl-[acyl-carrier-protein] synthase III
VVSIPTQQLYEANLQKFMDQFGITQEQVKFRARNTGYCGGASILLHFDEMVRSGELKAGDLVVLHSVESSKWMSAGFIVRW